MRPFLITDGKHLQITLLRFFLSILIFPLSGQVWSASIYGQVFAVHSGEQITLSISSNNFRKIQLSGIQAPPAGTAQGRLSRKYFSMLLAGKFVTVVYDTMTQQGLIIGQVLHGGVDMNQRMIEAGKARLHPHSGMDQQLVDRYAAAQALSQQNGLGMWQK
jgi:endonuclease YncB( thermonuclease family)